MKQQTATKWLAKLLIFVMLISVCGIGNSTITAKAAEILDVQLTGTYGQLDARSMLAMINAFRTGSDAWYWNEANTEQVKATGLSELTYDYNLEKIAMQRAMEIAVSFSHTRPNGQDCFSAYTSEYGASGENIAAGLPSAAATFEDWQETNEKWNGQGHRRNMLSSDFKSIGIGHVFFNGNHYWVQEFGDTVVSAEATAANESKTAVTVSISAGQLKSLAYTPSVKSYQLAVNENAALPKVSLDLSAKDAWPAGTVLSVDITELFTWQIEDTAIATISGTNILSVAQGTTTLVGTIGQDTVKIPVKVSASKPADNFSGTVISLSTSSYTYNGQPKKPNVTVKYDGTTLKQGTDYTVAYSNNTNAGTATVTVTGIGEYNGTATKTFTIKPKTIYASYVSLSPTSFTYDGQPKLPAVTVKYSGTTLTEGIDYTVAYSDNTNIGTATARITGIGNYTGTATKTFTIKKAGTTAKKNIAGATISLSSSSYTYDGTPKMPTVTVKYNGTTLKQGTDYSVTYSNNTNIGTATVKVTGIGNYTGTASKTFTIKGAAKKNLSSAVVTLSASSYTYDGTPKTPAVTVKYNGTTLKQGTDYTVTYSNNTDAGTATVKITGTGNYTGTVSKTFTIKKKPSKEPTPDESTSITVSLSPSSYTYDGTPKTPAVTVEDGEATLTEGTDYTVAYSDNTDAGTATVTVTGIGDYDGTASETFKIKKAPNKIKLSKSRYTLSYSAKKQTITLKPKAAAGKITYSSNNPQVKVSKKGKVTIAKKFSGKAVITIKVKDKNYRTATKKVVIIVKQR